MKDLKLSSRTCLLVIDMVKDNFDTSKNLNITKHALSLIDPINKISKNLRNFGGTVIYSTDFFNKDDFIFSAKMKPHSIIGTEGAELIDELEKLNSDKHFRKPSFSAFFKTNLASHLKNEQINTCIIAGIVTHICVLATALDSVANGFKTVLLSDCTASYSKELHKSTLNLYKKGPLYPLLRVTRSR